MKTGDYVRTEKGIIGKLVKEYTFDNGKVTYPEPEEWILNINGNKIAITEDLDIPIKSSPNIIDLIEAGDYVNKKEVAFIDEDDVAVNENDIESRDYEGRYSFLRINKKDIKSVVTHEQFKETEYKI